MAAHPQTRVKLGRQIDYCLASGERFRSPRYSLAADVEKHSQYGEAHALDIKA